MAVNTIGAGVILNEGSIDVDFRVESNGSANMLLVDGGNEEVLIQRAASGGTATAGSVLIVEDDDNTEISLLGGSSSLLAINFGHSGDVDDGMITYNTTSGSEAMQFTTNGGIRATIDKDGSVGIGTATPAEKLTVGAESGSGTGDNVSILINTETNGNAYLRFNAASDESEGAFIKFDHTAGASASQKLQFGIDWGGDSPKMTMTGDGKFGIGTTSPTGALHIAGTGVGANMYVDAHTNGGDGPNLIFRKSNHTTVGSFGTGGGDNDSAVDSGDILGQIYFQGADADSWETGGAIRAVSTEDWSASARGTKLEFYTVDNTTTTADLNMEIDHSGKIKSTGGMYFTGNALSGNDTGINASGDGGDLRLMTNGTNRIVVEADGDMITNRIMPDADGTRDLGDNTKSWRKVYTDKILFNGDTADDNALDDYEEGTWTPSFIVPSGSVGYSYQLGSYTKVGRLVTAILAIGLTSISSPSGSTGISGLPFSTDSGEHYVAAMTIALARAFTASYVNLRGYISQNSSNAVLHTGTTDAGGVDLNANTLTATTQFYGTFTYYTDE